MKRLLYFNGAILLGMAIGTFLWGCSPTEPSQTEYLCKSAPRQYDYPDGTSRLEIDTYSSSTPCPLIPLK